MKKLLKYSTMLSLIFLAGCGESPPPEPYSAPVLEGAIPESIGCEEGCERLNKFVRWQPYMHKVVELHRQQRKCRAVEYIGVVLESDPKAPTFFVMCENSNGVSYNTEYTYAQVEDASLARSDDVKRNVAYDACDSLLASNFPGYQGITQNDVERSFMVAANGRGRVSYDFQIGGQSRSASCLVGHDFVEFTVVR